MGATRPPKRRQVTGCGQQSCPQPRALWTGAGADGQRRCPQPLGQRFALPPPAHSQRRRARCSFVPKRNARGDISNWEPRATSLTGFDKAPPRAGAHCEGHRDGRRSSQPGPQCPPSSTIGKLNGGRVSGRSAARLSGEASPSHHAACSSWPNRGGLIGGGWSRMPRWRRMRRGLSSALQRVLGLVLAAVSAQLLAGGLRGLFS